MSENNCLPENEDLGMLYIQEYSCMVKIYKDKKGLYIHLPGQEKERIRITKREA